ncbi:MAG: MoaD/ThiS family protein [Myxococcales bacterium]
MKIMFYGRLAESIAPQIDLEAGPGSSIAEVRRLLAAEHPLAAATLANRRSVACVRGSVVRDDYHIVEGDWVEFLPPVSGG